MIFALNLHFFGIWDDPPIFYIEKDVGRSTRTLDFSTTLMTLSWSAEYMWLGHWVNICRYTYWSRQCIYNYIYICMCIYKHIYYTCIYTYICVYIYGYIYIYYTCIYIHIHTYIYKYILMNMYAPFHVGSIGEVVGNHLPIGFHV